MGSVSMTIDLANDYSPYPAGRSDLDGPFNGERFRKSVLAPAIREAERRHGTVVVDIDGVRTFGSSFLEEAFGGLIRSEGMSPKRLRESLEIKNSKPFLNLYRDLINKLIEEAARR